MEDGVVLLRILGTMAAALPAVRPHITRPNIVFILADDMVSDYRKLFIKLVFTSVVGSFTGLGSVVFYHYDPTVYGSHLRSPRVELLAVVLKIIIKRATDLVSKSSSVESSL